MTDCPACHGGETVPCVPVHKCDVAHCTSEASCRWTVESVNGYVLSPSEAFLCALHRQEAMKLTSSLSRRLARSAAK